jgi:hypothetical protein
MKKTCFTETQIVAIHKQLLESAIPLLVLDTPDHRAGTVNEQGAQIDVAALAHA